MRLREGLPATVDTTPPGVINRTTGLLLRTTSTAYTLHAASSVALYSLVKLALVSVPSTYGPVAPVPANVETFPPGVTTRTAYGSATMIFPVKLQYITANGNENNALDPIPSE